MYRQPPVLRKIMDDRFSFCFEVVEPDVEALQSGTQKRNASRFVLCFAFLLLFASVGCATSRQGQSAGQVQPRESEPKRDSGVTRKEVGVASYYAHKYHGKKTASGETYNMHDMTAAHRTLAFGSEVRVTNLTNGNSVVVRINDRGPYARGRVIDLSLAAARKLDMVRTGVARVEVSAGSSPSMPAVATLPR
jgi:rare lipoprotein A